MNRIVPYKTFEFNPISHRVSKPHKCIALRGVRLFVTTENGQIVQVCNIDNVNNTIPPDYTRHQRQHDKNRAILQSILEIENLAGNGGGPTVIELLMSNKKVLVIDIQMWNGVVQSSSWFTRLKLLDTFDTTPTVKYLSPQPSTIEEMHTQTCSLLIRPLQGPRIEYIRLKNNRTRNVLIVGYGNVNKRKKQTIQPDRVAILAAKICGKLTIFAYSHVSEVPPDDQFCSNGPNQYLSWVSSKVHFDNVQYLHHPIHVTISDVAFRHRLMSISKHKIQRSLSNKVDEIVKTGTAESQAEYHLNQLEDIMRIGGRQVESLNHTSALREIITDMHKAYNESTVNIVTRYEIAIEDASNVFIEEDDDD